MKDAEFGLSTSFSFKNYIKTDYIVVVVVVVDYIVVVRLVNIFGGRLQKGLRKPENQPPLRYRVLPKNGSSSYLCTVGQIDSVNKKSVH